MSTAVDRALVLRLLQDETLSFREIARRSNCSDWSVRFIARDTEVDPRTDDLGDPCEPLTPTEWWIFAGIAALVAGGLCFAAWRMPPLDGGAME